jgi:hypothetical protein
MLRNTGATLVIIIDETPPNFIERKHPRKGEKKKGNKGQGRKSRQQANSPTMAGHKEKREPV